MTEISYGPASALSLEAVADLYTRTFADYYYDARITADLMVDYQRVEQIDLDRSPVQYVAGEAVGLATVGLRGTRACCKGFGVIVPYRGRGLAQPLCMEVIRQAKLAGATSLQLGVVQHNERAVKTYLNSGFRIARDLISFDWQAPVTTEVVTTTAGSSDDSAQRHFSVSRPVSADANELLAHFAHLHPVPTTWGHDLLSLRELRGLHALTLGDGERVFGYVLYQPDGRGSAEVVDLAAEDPNQGAALLQSLQTHHARIFRNNETADSPMVAALELAGFRETLRRYEMMLDL